MDRLSALLPTILRQRGLQAQLHASLVVTKTDQWITQFLPEFSCAVHAQHFTNGSLICRAKHSIASEVLSTRSHELIVWLEKEVPGIRIHAVRVMR